MIQCPECSHQMDRGYGMFHCDQCLTRLRFTKSGVSTLNVPVPDRTKTRLRLAAPKLINGEIVQTPIRGKVEQVPYMENGDLKIKCIGCQGDFRYTDCTLVRFNHLRESKITKFYTDYKYIEHVDQVVPVEVEKSIRVISWEKGYMCPDCQSRTDIEVRPTDDLNRECKPKLFQQFGGL